MLNKYSRFTLCIIALLTTLPAWSGNQFNSLYVFGDSLSDTGNLASLSQPFPLPFFNNRITNGPNSVDVLAQQLGLSAEASLHLVGPAIGTNYSVAGARAGGEDVIDLSAQISAFLINQGGTAPQDALYIVFIGGNDIRDARDKNDIRLSIRTVINAVKTERKQIQKLIDAGAKNIMVYNAPDIGRIPDTQIAAQIANDNRLARRATNFSRLYNILLKFNLKNLEFKNSINFIKFNFFDAFSNLLNNPEEMGFTNATQACFSQITFSFNPECNFGANFPQFVFFDEIHPTARAHALLGNAATEILLEQLNENKKKEAVNYDVSTY